MASSVSSFSIIKAPTPLTRRKKEGPFANHLTFPQLTFPQSPPLTSVPSPKFGIRAKDLELEKKVQAFKNELSAIVKEDQAKPTHLFERVNESRIQTQVQNFLSRQKKAGAHPVPFMIALAGGSNSGKTTFLHEVRQLLEKGATQLVGWNSASHGFVVDYLELDSYYKSLANHRKALGDKRFFSETNLDEPKALLWENSQKTLFKLKNGIADRAPVYDFKNSQRTDGASLKVPAPFVIFEGLFALAPEPLRKLADLKIFVNCDEKTRTDRFWGRAPQRNVKKDEAGYALLNKALSMHNLHIQPTEKEADIVINGALPKEEITQRVTPLVNLMVKTFYPPTFEASDDLAPSQTGAQITQNPIKKLLFKLLPFLK
ncbi:MAG: hypothetical protein K2X66_01630 [Cyanobacteria bacterium]|nr:hypothetical protein [Cyanobacteriota bacterium]